jgi:hypothetical protein
MAVVEPETQKVEIGTYKVTGKPYTTYLGIDTYETLPVDTVITVNETGMVSEYLTLGKATATVNGVIKNFHIHPNDIKQQKIVKTSGGGKRCKSKKRHSQKRKSRRSRR